MEWSQLKNSWLDPRRAFQWGIPMPPPSFSQPVRDALPDHPPEKAPYEVLVFDVSIVQVVYLVSEKLTVTFQRIVT